MAGLEPLLASDGPAPLLEAMAKLQPAARSVESGWGDCVEIVGMALQCAPKVCEILGMAT
jgi:hypothetical protein